MEKEAGIGSCMNRRKALLLTASVLGGTLIGADMFLSGCTGKQTQIPLFSEGDAAFLDEVGETILPETPQSPGARAAGIGPFMQTMVSDCYAPDEQQRFTEGISNIRQRAKQAYSKDFVALAPEEKHTLLAAIDTEAANMEGEGKPHYFRMMKELTLLGYFTSEPGATRALRYNPVPGKYIGCIPYREGDKAWAG